MQHKILVRFYSANQPKGTTKTEHLDAHLGQFVLQAQLHEAEAYSDNFRD